MSLRHLLRGIETVRENRALIAIAFLPKLVLALLFVMPLYGLVSSYGHRPAITGLLTEWDMTVILDGVFGHRAALGQYGWFSLVSMIIVYGVYLFLGGGILRTLAAGIGHKGGSFSLEQFLVWCSRHFIDFLKIAVMSAIAYVAVAALWILASEAGLHIIAGDRAPEPVRFIALLARVAVLVLLLMLVNMAATYTRIAAVVNPGGSLRGILSAMRRFWKESFAAAVFLYLTLMLGLVLIVAVYWSLSAGSGLLPTAMGVMAMFVVQQVLSLVRSWYRLVGYASQTGLYLSRQT